LGGVEGSVLGLCCCQGAESPWVLQGLGCRAWCSGELIDGWVEEMLSLNY
jgi:hypothetical protein